MTLKIMFLSLSILSSTWLSADPIIYFTDAAIGLVFPLDLATNTTLAPITAQTEPTVIALTPDQTKAYVSGFNGILPIDLTTNTPGALIDSGTYYFSIAITPDGTTAYAAQYFADAISVLDLATNSITEVIALPPGSAPRYIAITPDGTAAYAGLVNGIARINTKTNMVESILSFPGFTVFTGLTFNADGSILYAIDVNSSQVFPIAIPSETVGSPIPAGLGCTFMVISPDGTMGYVSNTDENSITTIDLTTNTSTTTSYGFDVLGPVGLYINSEGTLLYTANYYGGNINIISIPDNNVVGTITGFGSPFWFGVPPLSIATGLTGTLALNTFLNRTDVILIVPVPTDTFTGSNAAYILYNNGVAVASSPVSSTALFVLPTNFMSSSAVLTINAVSSNGTVNGSVSVTINS